MTHEHSDTIEELAQELFERPCREAIEMSPCESGGVLLSATSPKPAPWLRAFEQLNPRPLEQPSWDAR